MALEKQPIAMNFAKGLDTKTDHRQVELGKFLMLENAIFDDGASLKKRDGYPRLTVLPNTDATNLSIFNGNLLATGSILQAWSPSTDSWLNRGTIQPVQLDTLSLVRSSTGQTNPDVAVHEELALSVYLDSTVPYYQINDSSTGQVIISRTALPATATTPRVFCLDDHFLIVFVATVTATSTLQYIAVPYLNPTVPTSATNISTSVLALTTGMDGYVVNGTCFLAWTGSAGGAGEIRMAYVNSALTVSTVVAFAGHQADAIAVTADTTPSNPIIWVSIYNLSGTAGWCFAVTTTLLSVLAYTSIIGSKTCTHITNVAKDGVCTTFYDNQSVYSYSLVRSDFINLVAINQAGSLITSTTLVDRSVQIASKAFYAEDGNIYMLVVYGNSTQSNYQPTYFLINSSGQVISKLAYSNAYGYYGTQKVPNVNSVDGAWCVGYLKKDFLVPINKSVDAITTGGVYTQSGVNVASFTINNSNQFTEEIASSLHLTGGFMWQYDGLRPVEHGFHLYPEDLEVNFDTGTGDVADQTYYYCATYEWTDYAGNIHRSAPSLPFVGVASGGPGHFTVDIPTLRLTYKLSPNPVRIVLYRWSTAQPIFYQVTSISSPTANSTTADSVQISDSLADATILGNPILYTTGGVVENIAAPALAHSCLYKNRLMALTAENRDVVWYSKQVTQNVPIEMSDLFSIYVAPTTGAQGSTGPTKAISAMDDKFIMFKDNAIYYMTGNGPDATGNNNDFSEPTYITGVVGTSNPSSVIFTPIGIMFQSDKGIWLLGRDLGTKYIGADVEIYNNLRVLSAVCPPDTNEVRFTLEQGITLIYDYYYDQWGTFTGIEHTSSVIYNDMHTILARNGIVQQQTAGVYMDGSRPVLMKFKTAWFKLTGLQGYQRAYFMYLLSNYISPYKLNVQIGYDYQTSPSQTVLLTPNQISNTYGSSNLWGSDPNWGLADVDQRRVFFDKQKCQAVQVTVSEVFNNSQGTQPGAGLVMSGINMVIGAKSGYPRVASSQNAG